MNKIKTYHRFIDEAGDTTFCNSKGEFIIGNEGVSKSFGIGMLKIKEPINDVRNKIITKQKEIENDKYVNTIPSVKKRIQKGGFFFHCSKDVPEIRMIFYNFINSLDCSFEMIVARKLEKFYNDIDHNFKESSNFYSEILGHLLKNKLQTEPEMILYIAERGKTTSNKKIEEAITKAKQRYKLNPKNKNLPIATKINFMVKKQSAEPILNIVDYLCWAVQRIFEKGETRYYDFLTDKISLVVDLYDTSKYKKGKNYYNKKNPLTKEGHIK